MSFVSRLARTFVRESVVMAGVSAGEKIGKALGRKLSKYIHKEDYGQQMPPVCLKSMADACQCDKCLDDNDTNGNNESHRKPRPKRK